MEAIQEYFSQFVLVELLALNTKDTYECEELIDQEDRNLYETNWLDCLDVMYEF